MCFLNTLSKESTEFHPLLKLSQQNYEVFLEKLKSNKVSSKLRFFCSYYPKSKYIKLSTEADKQNIFFNVDKLIDVITSQEAKG